MGTLVSGDEKLDKSLVLPEYSFELRSLRHSEWVLDVYAKNVRFGCDITCNYDIQIRLDYRSFGSASTQHRLCATISDSWSQNGTGYAVRECVTMRDDYGTSYGTIGLVEVNASEHEWRHHKVITNTELWLQTKAENSSL